MGMHNDDKMRLATMNKNNLPTVQDKPIAPPRQSNAIDILEQFMKYQLHLQTNGGSSLISALEPRDNLEKQILQDQNRMQALPLQNNQLHRQNHLDGRSIWNKNVTAAPVLSLTEVDNLRIRSNSANPLPPKSQRCIGKTRSVGNLSVGSVRATSISDRSRKAGKSTRHRRKSSELLRRFQCPHKDCKHRYEARRSVVQHIKAKHNSVGIEWSPIVLEVGEALGQNKGFIRSASDAGGVFVWENHSADDFRSAGSSPAIGCYPTSHLTTTNTLSDTKVSSILPTTNLNDSVNNIPYARNNLLTKSNNANVPGSYVPSPRLSSLEQNTIASPDPIMGLSFDAHDSLLDILMK